MIKLLRLLVNEPVTVYRKLLYRLLGAYLRRPAQRELGRQLMQVLSASPHQRVFIFPSPGSPWGYMFQRPQQLARTLAEEGHLVFYFVEPSFPYEPDWSISGVREIEPNLYLYCDGRAGSVLLEQLAGRKAYVWQYWPSQFAFAKQASDRGFQTIYDCIDHLTTFQAYPGIQYDFEASLDNANWLLATSTSIEEELVRRGHKPLLVSNGVRIGDFAAGDAVEWEEMDLVKENFEVVVGYYGAIAPWFDFELVSYVAAANPSWAFVIVGEVYAEVEAEAASLTTQRRNVQLMPRISYQRIPKLLAYFDIAMLPFQINDITTSTSPVKIFEYMAGGKVTVSTALPEVNGYEGVLVAENRIQFQEFLLKARQQMMQPALPERIRSAAAAHTWGHRAAQVLQMLDENGCEAR